MEKTLRYHSFNIIDDATHQLEQVVSSGSSDPLLIPSEPITRARAKRFKEAFNGLIKDIWAKHLSKESTNVKNDLSIIQTAMEVTHPHPLPAAGVPATP